MSNQKIRFEDNPSPVRAVDNGDGTFSLAVSQSVPVLDGGAGLTPNGSANMQSLTVDATAGGKQFSAFPVGTTQVLFTVDDADVRFTLDGSAPTASAGLVLPAGSERCWPVGMVTAAKFIRKTATSGVIHATPLKAA